MTAHGTRTTTDVVDAWVQEQEIRWLASFGMNNHSIARQLNLTSNAVEYVLTGRKAGPRERQQRS